MSGLVVTGLGPGDLERLPADVLGILEDPTRRVILRTLRHPAAEQLARRRAVETCDDLYESEATFEDVYAAIADRVLEVAEPVVYAVPGSPLIAERSVVELRSRAAARGREMVVIPTSSFLDDTFALLEIDPAARGFQVLDGRDLPSPLPYHVPIVVFHVDVPVVLADVTDTLGRVLPPDCPVAVVTDAGASTAAVAWYPLSELPSAAAGPRTTLYLDPPPAGYVGAVQALRRLRVECPWDREQTHDSLLKYLIEETHELAEAIGHLPPGSPAVDEPDYGAYAEVEDELGDVLLQVIFHANLAAEVAAFDIEDVAERLREKLVRRHPHVFGDVEVADADEVVRNWRSIKAEEGARTSLLDGIPSMPALQRAIAVQSRVRHVGFDWESVEPVLADVEGELAELRADLDDPQRAADELGDVLFALANLARHLRVDPDVALRRAVHRFERRFRRMEEMDTLEGKSIEELDRLWNVAKQEERDNDAG